MSYILDALKKASAEREQARGVAPGLTTQPVRTLSGAPVQMGGPLDQRSTLLWVLVLLTALILCAVTLGALFRSRSEPLPTPPPAQQTATSTVTPVEAPTGQTTPLSTAVSIGTPATPPQPVRVAPAPPRLSPPALPRPTALSPSPAKPESSGVVARPRPAPTLSTLPTQPAPLPMPSSMRATLAPLVISGSTYSDNPAFRMLILNGQVYREGEFPTPDLKLEQIRPKSAIVSYQGNTYVLTY